MQPAPKRMGKYELGRLLGTGNFSKVRLGVDMTNNETFAIKIIDKSQLARERLEEQLRREIAVLKLLRHKNIVTMREVLQTTRHIYIVLELVTGGELFDKIVASTRFSEDIARKYFQQLIMAVRYCHQQGIAHRDLKPENLLLDSDGNVKISDFGLANLQHRDSDMMTTVCGTPNYVAPEVIKDRGYNGFTADVWSCGIILYVMLSGHQAFDDPNLRALFNKIERGDYRMSRHFSEGARNLIGRILVVDPAQRYTINDIVNDPWFRVGFDPAELALGSRVEVSAQEVGSAMGDLEEGAVSPQARDDLSATRGGTVVASGDDGFALATKLLNGAILGAPHLPLAGVDDAMAVAAVKKFNHAASHAVVTRPVLLRVPAAAAFTALNDYFARVIGPSYPRVRGDPTLELKAFVAAKHGLLTFLVELTPVVSGQHTLAEFKKGRGDVGDFNLFVEQLASSLDGALVGCELLPWGSAAAVSSPVGGAGKSVRGDSPSATPA